MSTLDLAATCEEVPVRPCPTPRTLRSYCWVPVYFSGNLHLYSVPKYVCLVVTTNKILRSV